MYLHRVHEHHREISMFKAQWLDEYLIIKIMLQQCRVITVVDMRGIPRKIEVERETAEVVCNCVFHFIQINPTYCEYLKLLLNLPCG